MMTTSRISGAVLVGGRSKRMGGVRKALLPLAGKPLLQHVLDRLHPQVDSVMLSVERESADFSPYGLPQVADPVPGSLGPLGGLLATLFELPRNSDWLLLLPCDAPFLPMNLAERLLHCALESTRPGSVIRYDSHLQPTFALWHRKLSDALEDAVMNHGVAGFKQFLGHQPLAVLDWQTTEVSPFFNINDSEALAEAQRLIDLRRAPI